MAASGAGVEMALERPGAETGRVSETGPDDNLKKGIGNGDKRVSETGIKSVLETGINGRDKKGIGNGDNLKVYRKPG